MFYFENSFTFDIFKLFLLKNDFAFLHNYHTIECIQHQKNKNWWIKHKWPYLMSLWIPKYQQNKNLCPKQSRITSYILQWDTLFVKALRKLHSVQFIANATRSQLSRILSWKYTYYKSKHLVVSQEYTNLRKLGTIP